MSTSTPVASISDLPAEGRLIVEVDGRPIALFAVDGAIYAIDDACTHDGGPLAEGELSGCVIECPRHGARFDVRTGQSVGFPAYGPVSSHPVSVRDGQIYVSIDE